MEALLIPRPCFVAVLHPYPSSPRAKYAARRARQRIRPFRHHVRRRMGRPRYVEMTDDSWSSPRKEVLCPLCTCSTQPRYSETADPVCLQMRTTKEIAWAPGSSEVTRLAIRETALCSFTITFARKNVPALFCEILPCTVNRLPSNSNNTPSLSQHSHKCITGVSQQGRRLYLGKLGQPRREGAICRGRGTEDLRQPKPAAPIAWGIPE